MSSSLQSHELQHARPPCPSPTPGVHSNSCPSSWWCHPAISSSVVPFSFCPQSLPASGSFPMSQLFSWGGQSTGVSALASFLPKKSQGWSLSEWTGWISLQSKGLSGVFSNTTVQKHQFFMYLKKSEIIIQTASCNAHFSLPFLIVLFQFISIVNGSAVNQVLRHLVLHTGAGRAGRKQGFCVTELVHIYFNKYHHSRGIRAWALDPDYLGLNLCSASS